MDRRSRNTIQSLTVGIFFVLLCRAQQPEFEVASIKPSPPPTPGRMMFGTRGGPGTPDPGRFSCTNCTLMMLVTQAYDLQRYQVSGPATLDSEHFEITAKVPEGATKEQFRLMIQKLLADRFKLVVHRESKEMPIYQLVVGKNGPKLKESSDAEEAAAPAAPGPLRSDKDGYPVLPAGRSLMAIAPGGARMQGAKETMDQFAKRLSAVVGRPVTDATGLTGKYDFVLSWSPDMGRLMAGMPPPPGGPPGADAGMPATGAPQDNGPTILTALQEQLGLRLDQKKGPVDTLVVDHVEKAPTEN